MTRINYDERWKCKNRSAVDRNPAPNNPDICRRLGCRQLSEVTGLDQRDDSEAPIWRCEQSSDGEPKSRHNRRAWEELAL